MPIPVDVFDEWRKPDPIGAEYRTFEETKGLLYGNANELEYEFGLNLVGSIAKGTNFDRPSDVDVNIFPAETTSLGRTDLERSIYQFDWKSEVDGRATGRIDFEDFRSQVESLLASTFADATIRPNRKAISVERDGVEVEVAPGVRFRKEFDYDDGARAVRGIYFEEFDSGEQFVQFPEADTMNFNRKNIETRGNHRETVRVFKEARLDAHRQGIIDEIIPMSNAYVESLVYNIPNDVLLEPFPDRFEAVLRRWEGEDLRSYVATSECRMLFDDDPSRCGVDRATEYVSLMRELWETR